MKDDVGSRGMSEVDKQDDPRHIIAHLDAARAVASIQALKRTTFELLRVAPGHHLLDVGCGTGEDVLALAALAGATGRAVGVDASNTLVAEAKARAEGSGANVEFRSGDVHVLDVDDASFDGVRAERVFQHLDDPRRALAEMVRVARRGARIVVVDPDWETFTVDAADARVTRAILNHGVDSYVRNGWIGRRLFGLFRQAGLDEVEITPFTEIETGHEQIVQTLRLAEHAERAREAGLVSAAEAEAWLDGLAEAGRTGRLFCSLTYFIASGTNA